MAPSFGVSGRFPGAGLGATAKHKASEEEDDKDESTDRWKMFKALTKKQSDEAIEDEGKESDDDGEHDETDSIAEEDEEEEDE